MKKSFVALLVAITIVVPSVSFAAGLTQSQVDAILSLLRSFNADQSVVSNVETALTGAKPPVSSTFCYNWEKNLRVGDGQRIDTGATGLEADISALYLVLGKYEHLFDFDLVAQPGTAGSSMRTSYFSEQLASYVVQFQEKYRSEILTPNGLVRGTGYVGVSTRAKLLRLYGCTVSSNRPPVISGLDAPTTLAVGEVGTWAVKASDPEGKSLSYSVVWGDEVSAGTLATSPMAERLFIQTATFTHSYGTAGVYTPVFYVKDADGQVAKTSASVRVGGGGNTSQIQVISPNGGESWQKGTTQTIKWQDNRPVSSCKFDSTTGITTCPTPILYDLKLAPYYPPCTTGQCPLYEIQPYTIANSVNNSSYSWNVGSVKANWCLSGIDDASCPQMIAPDGSYTVQVCQTGTTTCDSSDSYFKIYSPNTTTSTNIY